MLRPIEYARKYLASEYRAAAGDGLVPDAKTITLKSLNEPLAVPPVATDDPFR
jgi:hypothetical protein